MISKRVLHWHINKNNNETYRHAWPLGRLPDLNSKGTIFSTTPEVFDSTFTLTEASIIPFNPYLGAQDISSISITYIKGLWSSFTMHLHKKRGYEKGEISNKYAHEFT